MIGKIFIGSFILSCVLLVVGRDYIIAGWILAFFALVVASIYYISYWPWPFYIKKEEIIDDFASVNDESWTSLRTATLRSDQTCNHSDVFSTSKAYISSLITDNGITPDKVRVDEIQHEYYPLYIRFMYAFRTHVLSTVDREIDDSDDKTHKNLRLKNEEDFRAARTKYTDYANSDLEKTQFIQRLLASRRELLSVKNGVYTIWQSPEFSYSKKCSSCHGNGRSRCTTCHGTGSTPCRGGIDSRGNPASREACYCDGGYIICGACKGAGSFMHFGRVVLEAKQKTTLMSDYGLRRDAILKFLETKTNEYLNGVAPLRIVSHSLTSDGILIIYLASDLCVVEESIIIHDQHYTEVAFNTEPSVLKPPIFDYVFKDPIENIKAVNNDRHINVPVSYRNRCLEAFANVRKYHHLDTTLKCYKSTGDITLSRDVKVVTAIITETTLGYVSEQFAKSAATELVKMMRTIAPSYTWWTWAISVTVAMLMETLFALMVSVAVFSAPQIVHPTPMFPPTIIFMLAMVFIIYTLFVSPISVILNIIITKNYQQYVAPEFRPNIISKKPYSASVIVVLTFWLAVMIMLDIFYHHDKSLLSLISMHCRLFVDSIIGAKCFSPLISWLHGD